MASQPFHALPTTVIDHAYFLCQLHHLVSPEEAGAISFLPAMLLCCVKASPLWAQCSEACEEWGTLCMNQHSVHVAIKLQGLS